MSESNGVDVNRLVSGFTSVDRALKKLMKAFEEEGYCALANEALRDIETYKATKERIITANVERDRE